MDELETARRELNLSVSELWLRYFALGGMSSALTVEAVLHGALTTSLHDRDLLAAALNERSSELGVSRRLAYSGDNGLDRRSGTGTTVSPTPVVVDRSEGFGERLLGAVLDRVHELPPHLIAPLVTEEIATIGGRDVSILLQDYDQLALLPLPGEGLLVGGPVPIDGSLAGDAFLGGDTVNEHLGDGVRVFVPLLAGTERVGVLAFTADRFSDDDRRLAGRFAAMLAHVLVTKGMHTDRYFQARRRQPMTLSAEVQWALLPPLVMTTPQVAIAGMLEPAYDVAGDSFDYALNGDDLHVAIIDAMGHGLDASVMATVAISAYRHARRNNVGFPDVYAVIDRAIAEQFSDEHFATVQLAHLDVATGRLRWVNGGHPHGLLVRGGRVVRALDSPTTLPAGFGGADPQVSEQRLEPGDRVLFFTDGITEEHRVGGELYGEARLINALERVARDGGSVAEVVRRLSHSLKDDRGGLTTDDSTLFLLEWRGGAPSPRPTGR